MKMKKALHFLIMLALIGLSASAQITFQKTFGTLNGNYGIGEHQVLQTFDGGYIILSNDVYYGSFGLIKTNANGDTLWVKYYSGGEEFSIQQIADGGYIITDEYVYLDEESVLVRLDNAGNILWANSYEHSDYGTDPESIDRKSTR